MPTVPRFALHPWVPLIRRTIKPAIRPTLVLATTIVLSGLVHRLEGRQFLADFAQASLVTHGSTPAGTPKRQLVPSITQPR